MYLGQGLGPVAAVSSGCKERCHGLMRKIWPSAWWKSDVKGWLLQMQTIHYKSNTYSDHPK